MRDDFPQRLRRLRRKKGVSQQVVADFCGLSKSTVARYERGEQEPTASAICRIAGYFEVSTDYLLGRTKKNFEVSRIRDTAFEIYVRIIVMEFISRCNRD